MTGFELWADDKDWLVEIVMFPQDEPAGDRDEVLNWIGRVSAVAGVTNTRMLAQAGDTQGTTYELWFSFDSPEHKQAFLDFVRSDGYADPDEEFCFDPPPPEALREIPRLRPPADVLPKKYMEQITAIAAITAQTIMESASGKVN